MEKYKASMVGRAFAQEEGVNYDETYAQMMRSQTLEILVVIALHRDWAIRCRAIPNRHLSTPMHKQQQKK